MVSDIPAGNGKLVNLFSRCTASSRSNLEEPGRDKDEPAEGDGDGGDEEGHGGGGGSQPT